MTGVRSQSKAIVGGLIAAASFLAPVIDDGLLASEALGALVAGLSGFAGVYWVRNGS